MEKQELNFVTGNGETIISPDRKIRLTIDYLRPVTLVRCKEILRAAERLSGRTLTKISLYHAIYSKSPGNECGDWAETCYLNMRYDYDLASNSLVIFKDNEPIYANDNGAICRDAVALMDSQE